MSIRWPALFMAHLLALWLCAAPAPAQGPNGGALSNPQTGVAGVYTAQTVISDHPHHVLLGHVIIATRGADTVRALVIGQRRDGVHALRFAEAWSDGVELPFTRTYGTGCTHSHCRDREIGMIFLSAALFDRATEHGLRARLIGPSGAIDIAAPAALFRAASAM